MKPDLVKIKNIVFDLGNVLLNLDFEASVKAFRKLGLSAEVTDRRQVYADPVFYDLEVGHATPDEFRKRVRQILDNPGATDQQIDDAWCAMVLDIPSERLAMLKKLGKNYQLHLFSNTNPVHISRFLEEFRKEYKIEFPSLFVKTYYSYEIHERKPDLSSFRKIIELSGIHPRESLFIDDLDTNIRGAQKAGFKTFWLEKGMEITELFY